MSITKMTVLVILNYNNSEDTINCIESIEAHNTAPAKLVVVDNGSERGKKPDLLCGYMQQRYGEQFLYLDDTALDRTRNASRVLPYATYIDSHTNDGYARGNNKGLYLVENDPEIEYVMILNNDILFIEDIIPVLCNYSETIKDAAFLSPLLYKRNMKEPDFNCARLNTTLKAELAENVFHYLFRMLRVENPYTKRRRLIEDGKSLPDLLPVELLSGACLFSHKTLFSSIGFFDPGTFLYYEENIIFKKIQCIGLRNYLAANLKCIHIGASSTSAVSEAAMLHAFESQLYYMTHYAGLTTWQYWLFKLSWHLGVFMFKMRNGVRKS